MKRLSLIALLCLSAWTVCLGQSDPVPTGYSWSDCSGSGTGVTVSSGTVTRTASSSGFQQAYVQCSPTVGYGTGIIALQVASTSDVLAFGLTNSGTWTLTPSAITAQSLGVGTSKTGPTYGIYLTGAAGLNVYNQEPDGSYRKAYTCSSCVQVNDWYMVDSSEGSPKYWRQRAGVSTVIYSSVGQQVSASYPLLPQVSISSNASSALVRILQDGSFGSGGTVWVSPTGGPYANGADKDHASTLALVANNSRPVPSGSTVIGTDGVFPGGIVWTISGVTFRAEHNDSYPPTTIISNATPVITLSVTGSNNTFKDIWIRNTDTTRSAVGLAGTNRRDGWTAGGTGNQLLNSLVTDEVNGIVSQDASGSLIYGNVSQNNGMVWSGSPAGHGLYVHNEPQRARMNIQNIVTLNNYKLAMQYWNQEDNTETGNTSFDKMVAINGQFGVLGNGPKDDISVTNIHGYKAGLAFGTENEQNHSFTATDNYFYSGGAAAQIRVWASFTFARNKLVDGSRQLGLREKTGNALTNYNFSQNVYYRGEVGSPANQSPQFTTLTENGVFVADQTFAQWKALSATFDPDSTFYSTANESGTLYSTSVVVRPGTTDVYVWPNAYQSGRGTITIWNWLLSNNVNVNFSTLGLVDGQKYDVYSIQSQKKLISQGTYSASSPTVSIPMNTDDPPVARIGDAASTPATTMPEFGTFLVMPGAQPTTDAPTAPSNLAISKCTLVLGCTLTWTSNSDSGPSADTGFIIDRSTDGVTFSNVTTTAAHAATYTNVPVSYGSYVYRIRAHNTAGDSVNQIFSAESNPAIFCYGILCPR